MYGMFLSYYNQCNGFVRTKRKLWEERIGGCSEPDVCVDEKLPFPTPSPAGN